MLPQTVYFSLGTNLGDREASLRSALLRLHSDACRIQRVSSVYETAPLYITNQPEFLNVVAEARTRLRPVRLLLRTAEIERTLGRRRTVRNGPRTIDIDILFFGDLIMETPQLVIPHPRLVERRFVLEPLAELAPDLRHPVLRKSVRELLAAAPYQIVRRTAIDITASA